MIKAGDFIGRMRIQVMNCDINNKSFSSKSYNFTNKNIKSLFTRAGATRYKLRETITPYTESIFTMFNKYLPSILIYLKGSIQHKDVSNLDYEGVRSLLRMFFYECESVELSRRELEKK
jgi:hypothetical protein